MPMSYILIPRWIYIIQQINEMLYIKPNLVRHAARIITLTQHAAFMAAGSHCAMQSRAVN